MNQSEYCPWCGTTVSREKFVEIENKIRSEEKNRLALLEKSLRQSLELERKEFENKLKVDADRRLIKANSDLVETQRKLANLESQLRSKIKQEIENDVTARFTKELAIQRQAFEKSAIDATAKMSSSFSTERQGYEQKIAQLQRQLSKRTTAETTVPSNQILDALRNYFTEDVFAKVRGLDTVVHQVFYKGNHCGSIVINLKVRDSWQSTFATNLRAEQIQTSAEHAILVTNAFPKDRKDVCIESEVIVCTPASLTSLVELLRKTMIRMHVQGLTTQDKDKKMSRIYDFISSETYRIRTIETTTLTNDLLDLDVKENKQHEKTWEKRGLLLMRLKGSLEQIDSEIFSILEDSIPKCSETDNPGEPSHVARRAA